jgi:hypothetical protein
VVVTAEGVGDALGTRDAPRTSKEPLTVVGLALVLVVVLREGALEFSFRGGEQR